MVVDQEKLAKLQAATRSGGKGTPRRKVVRKPKGASAGAGEDKKLQLALKKLNVQPVTGIEEVNMFKNDGNVLNFANARAVQIGLNNLLNTGMMLTCSPSPVHGLAAANTYAVYGTAVDKDLTELMPNILSQLGPDSLASLRKLAESYNAMNMGGGAGLGGAAGAEDDDEVPDVVQNFDEENGAEGQAAPTAAAVDVDGLD